MSKLDRPVTHQLELHAVLETGVEEWVCPECGRRFLVEWPPEYNKIIIEVGDDQAIHTGVRQQVEPPDDPPPSEWDEVLDAEDQARWRFWEDWMEVSRFETWWTTDLDP
jgi:hypothetical protein